jgi:thioredoxin reductase (NADPH)
MDNMRAQSERFGTEIITETISKLDLFSRPFKMWTEWNDAEGSEPVRTADAVIIATGANARRLNLPGEETYWQNGISACAVCDGAVPIFRNKPLYVIGGGDSAAEEAMFLAKYGSHVTVLVRKDKLRASKVMAERLLAHPKCTVRFHTVATEVIGESKPNGLMTHLRVKNVETDKEEIVDANGLFYAVGHDPANALVKGQVELDDEGYIVTKAGTSFTNVEGVFACGDVQDKRYRQAITSAGMSNLCLFDFFYSPANNYQDLVVLPLSRLRSSFLSPRLTNLSLRRMLLPMPRLSTSRTPCFEQRPFSFLHNHDTRYIIFGLCIKYFHAVRLLLDDISNINSPYIGYRHFSPCSCRLDTYLGK